MRYRHIASYSLLSTPTPRSYATPSLNCAWGFPEFTLLIRFLTQGTSQPRSESPESEERELARLQSRLDEFKKANAGIEADRQTGRRRGCDCLLGLGRGPLDHRRDHSRGRRLETLKGKNATNIIVVAADEPVST